MGIERYRPSSAREPAQDAKLGEHFGPLGQERPSKGPLDSLQREDASDITMGQAREALHRELASLVALLEEHMRTSDNEIKDANRHSEELEHRHEQGNEDGERGRERLHAHEDQHARHRHHEHGHDHGEGSGKTYAGFYEPTKDDLVVGWEREKQFLQGLAWGVPAVLLWALDSVVHLSPIPIDDVVVHGAAIYCTVRALGPLSKGWRGYNIPDEILKGKKEEYTGEGYPVSSITYARENLRGHYDEGRLKRVYSRAAIGLGYIGKTLGGVVHRTSHDVSDIWGYGVSGKREKGAWGFIKYTAEGIGRTLRNLYNDGPVTVLKKGARTVFTIIPSSIIGFGKGNESFLREYKAGALKPTKV